MKKYIYEFIKKMPEQKATKQIKEYKAYLKKEIDKAQLLGAETDHFEINYLLNVFKNGLDINFDYDNIEFIYYCNEQKVCGKGVIPPSEFRFRIDSNIMKIKFFDFELLFEDISNNFNGIFFPVETI